MVLESLYTERRGEMKRIITIILVIAVITALLFCSPLTQSKAQPGGYGYGYYEARIYQLENAHELDMQKIQDLNDAMNLGQVKYEELLTLYNQLVSFVEQPNPVTFEILSD